MSSVPISLFPDSRVGHRPARRLKRLYAAFLLILLVVFDSIAAVSGADVRIIGDVPFFPQERYRCGPASLAGVLNYWGVKVSPEEIAAEIYSPSAGGTLDIDMLIYVRGRGLKADIIKGSIEELKLSIDSDRPVVVLVDTGFWVYKKQHYMVMVGYDDEGVVVNSGGERLKHITYEDFGRTWEKGDYWTLYIGR